MKELKTATCHLEEFDIDVNLYFTLEQIQSIVNEVMKYSTYSQRQEVIIYRTLVYATSLTQEQVEALDPDMIVQSGLFEAVSFVILNFDEIDKAIKYHESIGKALQDLAPHFENVFNKIADLSAFKNKEKG